MITNNGRRILSKFLINQAPAYASYIAIGCGATPLNNLQNFDFDSYEDKQSLDFEMFRVPIISRGFVTKQVATGNGPDEVSEIVLTAELPTEERYEITEIGVFSAGSNPSASGNDSKNIFLFSDSENWEYHGESSAISIPYITRSLNSGSPDPLDPGEIYDGGNVAFRTAADNAVFLDDERINRNERMRFLSNSIFIRSDMSTILKNSIESEVPISQRLEPATGSSHIHLNGVPVNFDKYSPADSLKLAFSIINKNLLDSPPEKIRLVVEFSSSDVDDANAQYARFSTEIASSAMLTNRYFVTTIALEDLSKTSGFSWNTVSVIKAYVLATTNEKTISAKQVVDNVVTLTTSSAHGYLPGDVVRVEMVDSSLNGRYTITDTPTANQFSYSKITPNVSSTSVTVVGANVAKVSSNYYFGLDAMRVENTNTQNPLYGLTGYSVVKNVDGRPIVKNSNTSNLVEFRFAMDVV